MFKYYVSRSMEFVKLFTIYSLNYQQYNLECIFVLFQALRVLTELI